MLPKLDLWSCQVLIMSSATRQLANKQNMILLVREGVLICYEAIKYLTSVIVVVVPRHLESESGDYSMIDHLNRRSVSTQ